MLELPCPHCEAIFNNVDDLINHALYSHTSRQLTEVLRMTRQVTKEDFTQVDSHWVMAIDGFQMILGRNSQGEFKLTIVGTLEPIPPATAYPSEPEWERAIGAANKFIPAFLAARDYGIK